MSLASMLLAVSTAAVAVGVAAAILTQSAREAMLRVCIGASAGVLGNVAAAAAAGEGAAWTALFASAGAALLWLAYAGVSVGCAPSPDES